VRSPFAHARLVGIDAGEAQQLPGGDLYPALEKGVIDAAEWVAPYDDEKLGLHKVAKYYYYPGWWEGSATLMLYINQKSWDALPKDYQTAYEAAAFEANMRQLALYDAKNPDAIKRILASGVKLRWFPKDVLDAAYDMTQTMLEEISAKDAFFKSIYQHYRGFLEKQSSWYRVADHFLDNYSLARRAR
jgi:TRAP-type mannitol/chloroaromatic compound transport system substrate-binding protein